MTQGPKNRGAALIIAIAILAILMAIALAFFTTARVEFRTAGNILNAQKTDHIAKAGLAMGAASLNHDAQLHSTYTSIYHAWRSYWNAASFAGKPWTWYQPQPGLVPPDPLTAGNVPEIWIDTIAMRDEYGEAAIHDILTGLRDNLYVPRVVVHPDSLTPYRPFLEHVLQPGLYVSPANPTYNPFVFTDDVGVAPLADLLDDLVLPIPRVPVPSPPYPGGNRPLSASLLAPEQIHTYTDVDNDGDGLNDSMWYPIPQERFLTEDGLDNDLDGLVDEGPHWLSDGIDNDGNGVMDADDPGEWHPPELGLFVYYGGDDGLDNDRDGQIDELDENESSPGVRRAFLTAPLVDQDNVAFSNALMPNGYAGPPLNTARFSPDVDALDNDYSIVVNDSVGYSFDSSAITAEDRRHVQHVMAWNYFVPYITAKFGVAPVDDTYVVSCSGEPVCEVVGRVAILITDEASKVNLNSSGGLVFKDTWDLAGLGPVVTRALGDGVTSREYEFRTIPGIGTDYASRMWTLRTGRYDSLGFPMGANAPALDPYEYDMSFPGYGRVDDDGDALALMYNGLDDDGDAKLYDDFFGPLFSSDGFDNDLDGLVDEPGEGYGMGVDEGFQAYDTDGNLTLDLTFWPEGVDDPEELRRFSPFRNLLAESDNLALVDDDLDDAVNEIGELGDRRFRTRDQLKLVDQIAGARFNWKRNVITAHSIEKNIRRQIYDEGGNRIRRSRPSGMKLHYNYSRARSIGDALIEDWDYRRLLDFEGADDILDTPAEQFSLGLQQEAVSLIGQVWGPPVDRAAELGFRADPVLRAYQLGASVQDGHDRDHARTEVTTELEDTWWDNLGGITERRPIRHTVGGVESIRINEMMIRAVRRVEAEAITDPGALWDPATNPEAVRYPTRADDPADPAYLVDGWRQYDPNWLSSVVDSGNNLIGDFDLAVQTLNPALVFDAAVQYSFLLNPTRWEPFITDDAALGRKNVMSWHRVGELGTPLPADPPRAIPMGAAAHIAAASQLHRVPSYLWLDVDDNPNTDVNADAHDPVPGPDPPGGDVPGVTAYKAPNLVQFRFGPSPGLPPGRYYLLANTKDEAGVPTVLLDEEYRLNYAFKYGPVDPVDDPTDPNDNYNLDTIAGSILRDVQNGWVNLTGSEDWVDPAAPPTKIPYGLPIVGMTEDGAEETGLVMLSSTGEPFDTSTFPVALQGYFQDYANTIIIPPYTDDPATPADEQEYLYVAVWRGATPPGFVEDYEDGFDNDGDGLIDENPYMHSDGLDNDGDGSTDEADENPVSDGVDNDGDGSIDEADENPDWNWDGADNDGDGDIDEYGEGYMHAYESAPLAVNSFDFSQEPDHEWVEIVNVAQVQPNIPLEEQSIELSGWQLEVRGNAANVGRIVATVPDGTFIAPGGSLLLGFNKFDAGAVNFLDGDDVGVDGDYDFFDWSDVYKNGIGLARAPIVDVFGDLSDVSVPLMPNTDPEAKYPGLSDPTYRWPLGNTPTLDVLDPEVYWGSGFPAGVSLFDRTAANPISFVIEGVDRDVIDRDGNGYADEPIVDTDVPPNGVLDATAEDLVQSTLEYAPLGAPIQVFGVAANPNRAAKAWDRIVELETPVLEDIRDLPTMAQWVLRGGIFPNYPEHDGLDNDADGPVLMSDGVDNNGDTTIDEDGEGIDESRMEVWGGYPPGSFSDASVRYLSDAFDLDPTVLGNEYLGTDGDAPEWKEFVERKFFPGDCVVVTLYEGFADTGRVADRVTYTERDVINRSLRDVLPDLYTDSDGDGVPDTLAADGLPDPCPYVIYEDANADGLYEAFPPITLDARYPSMWPDNIMALDFYRSIERKHPLYNGDLYGTQNRWESTDGNYDDWAAGMGATTVLGSEEIVFWLDRPDLGAYGLDRVEYGHALNGSPLRANMSQRSIEALSTDAFLSPLSEGGATWPFDLAGVRNRNYISPGDVATMPHMAMVKYLYPYAVGTPEDAYLNAAGDDLVVDLMVGTTINDIDDVLAGSPMDLASLISSASHDEIVLTCAQADFYPITPSFANAVADPNLATWTLGTSYPAAWSPVFLFELGELAAGGIEATVPYMQAYPLDPNLYLFNTPGAPNGYPLPPGLVVAPPALDEFRARWPLFGAAFGPNPVPDGWPITGRAAMYISGNINGFDPDATSHSASGAAAEALFIWEVEDGVENGEYDVFIAVGEDLSSLAGSPMLLDTGPAPPGTADGAKLVDAAARTFQHEMVIDAEFFADQDGDGRIWTDDLGGDRLPQNSELHRGGVMPFESFGLLPELTPDTDGLVHYGTINVQRNQVALFLRNWAKPGVLNRFSRVILTPRQRTEGRINVNTATTRLVENSGNWDAFNALIGLPGVLGQWDVATGAFGHVFNDADDIVPGDPGRIDAMDLSAQIAAERPEWWDGRYYRHPSDLISVLGGRALSPLDIATRNYEALGNDVHPTEFFREVVARYTRLGNLITTRSDVFEILVTAQAGYAYDEDGDGHINYRSDNEFIVNGEKKVRTVYERREPEEW